MENGQPEAAFDALFEGIPGRTDSRIDPTLRSALAGDLTLIAAHWAGLSPSQLPVIQSKLTSLGLRMTEGPTTRFALHWETDANDVDLHVYDRSGEHAYHGSLALTSGGQLLGDVVSGYGPELFVIPAAPTAYPYTLRAHYYRRGPMGHGLGMLHVTQLDAAGHLQTEVRPFVVMRDGAYVSLGTLEGPLPRPRARRLNQYVPPAPVL